MRHSHPSGLLALAAFAMAPACGPQENPFGDDDSGVAGESAGGSSAGVNGTSGAAGAGGRGMSGSSAGGGSSGIAGSTSPSGGTSNAGTSNAGTSNATGGTNTGAGGSGTAGTSTTGGQSTAGSSGSGTAGSNATGGAAPTSGCEATTWPPAQTNSLMVEGTDVPREFIVALPEDYDQAHPYRVVFAFHGLTGTAEQIAGGRGGGYYGLESRIGSSSVLVAPQGLAPEDEPDQYGWPNQNGRDIAFVRAMLTWLGSNYCIDQSRIFSVGFSYGGIMSNTIGCEMADVFRGIAPIAGALFGRGNNCMEPPIAAWMAHGTADETVTFEQGETARDTFLAKNHCDTSLEPTPVEPEGCVSYQGCDGGFPLTWCAHDGGHMVPSFTGEAVSDFFSSF